VVFVNTRKDIEMNLRIRKDKMDDIRALYAGISMKEAAGCAEKWEVELIHTFKINKDTYSFIGKIRWDKNEGNTSVPIIDDRGIYIFMDVNIGTNPIEYLSAIAPSLEDGFIRIKQRSFSGPYDGVWTFAVRGGNLYNTVTKDGSSVIRGDGYMIGEKIIGDKRIKDSNYGIMIIY